MQNTVTIVGNLTDDPELRETPSGTAVANFSVAVNRYKGKDQDSELDGFFDVSVWRDQAEHVAENIRKGERVIVVGSVRQRTWETNDGDKRSKVEIQAEEVGRSERFAAK